MPIPYLLTTLLYTFVAVLAAADSSLINFNLLGSFPALVWVRVHFITLGILAQVIFGLLPGLVASLAKKPRPFIRWDIWLTLNAGFVALIAGFSGMTDPMIFAGGSLVFISVILLLSQLWRLRGGESRESLKFYMTGLAYLLVGAIIGTGMFLGWGSYLLIKDPLEAHIHANSWGFMSLVFAGLLVDFVPMITGRPLGASRFVSVIYWGMTVGAFSLVLSPWLGGNVPSTIVGLVAHMTATIWLIVLMIGAFKKSGKLSVPGVWHLVLSYIWIIAPIVASPFILLGIFERGPIESTAPRALIYGWVLGSAIALAPYIARRYFLNDQEPRLGGSWASLATVTLGSVFVWASVFIVPARGILHGIGFALYALTLIQPLMELFEIARDGLKKYEPA